jgi:hypothetical protein
MRDSVIKGPCLRSRTRRSKRSTARAGNRRFSRISARRAHTTPPYKNDLLWRTLTALDRPGVARTVIVYATMTLPLVMPVTATSSALTPPIAAATAALAQGSVALSRCATAPPLHTGFAMGIGATSFVCVHTQTQLCVYKSNCCCTQLCVPVHSCVCKYTVHTAVRARRTAETTMRPDPTLKLAVNSTTTADCAQSAGNRAQSAADHTTACATPKRCTGGNAKSAQCSNLLYEVHRSHRCMGAKVHRSGVPYL